MIDEMTPDQAIERAIRARRAIRAFRPDPVEPALVRRLIDLAAQAPSGTNMQPWKLRVIGPQTRARLEAALLAALDAGGAGGPLVLARSDGLGKGESFDQVLARVKAYSDAGAEMIFVSGASLEQKKKISEVTAKPLFSTGGPATVTEEAAVGVKVPAFAIEPYALGASHAAMSALLKDGKIAGLPTVPREASLAIADAKMWAEIHQKYNADKA